MNIGSVAKAAGWLFGILTGMAIFGKLDEISKRVGMLNHNQLVLSGYDPATGQKQQPERYQIFETAVPE